ncbi:Rrf2 family transcriptional regulator [Isobaculum melis]|uniref:DNA-binding transcriptional regulator, IscR family n=1 Tax=Isobaculum melis TaxID=142588 RepID=A0A1H9UHF9_9LACT|nr:Rrf2 family transcriptional regulator [Isobaculum melis]SES08980.1 DNA-binding transcriptional regulator, IscR family [Isobaculum melis]
MEISTKFTVAVHVMTLLALNKDKELTSAYLAGSVNTNPVVIRRIMGQLKQADLILTKAGVAGAVLTRSPEDISLLAIYRAVIQQPTLFGMHQDTNLTCTVGATIQQALEGHLLAAQQAMEASLANVSLADIIASIHVLTNEKK